MHELVRAEVSEFFKLNNKFQKLIESWEIKGSLKQSKSHIVAYNNNLTRLNELLENKEANNSEQALSITETLCTMIPSIIRTVLRDLPLSEKDRSFAKNIETESKELQESISETRKVALSLENNKKDHLNSFINQELQSIARIRAEQEAERSKYSSMINSIENRISQAEKNAINVYEVVKEQIQKIDQLYENSREDLEKKRTESSLLLEAISRDSFSGNYEERAIQEEAIADKLRAWSIAAMIIAIVIIVVTVIEASINNYSIANAALRFGLIFAVTVPSAYLARESSKHREKHNNYLEKSLDLKALSPFIASLEKEDQDKIKSTMADRLFARSKSIKNPEDLAISSSEIAFKILDKVKDQKS